jgi:hypothetical protein
MQRVNMPAPMNAAMNGQLSTLASGARAVKAKSKAGNAKKYTNRFRAVADSEPSKLKRPAK